MATQEYYSDIGLGWIIYCLFGVLYVGLAATFTVYVGPGAAGSGTAEMMGYLNGVRYPNFLGVETLLIKIFGVALAVSGGLHIGKEGPLAHIGSNIGAFLVFIPARGCNNYFRNERDMRKVIAVGSGVGVAVAFASPIGGTIFAYQVTRPHVYWTFTLLLKTFWASSLATFVLNICVSLREGKFVGLANTGLIKFGDQIKQDNFRLQHLPFVVVAGAICGLLGALFVYGNTAITRLRKKYLTQNYIKVLESVGMVVITGTIIYVIPLITGCNQVDSSFPDSIHLVTLKCSEGSFNKLATLLWQTEGSVIQVLFSPSADIEWQLLLIFFLVWYILTMVTYGTAVPAGLFFPGILMGCALGLLLANIFNSFLEFIAPTNYAIACASGILCGYSRLSLSLVILVMQTTQNISLFVPVLMTTLAALWVGQLFTHSLYENAVQMKGIPFLPDKFKRKFENITAREIMTSPVYYFNELETVKYIYKVLSVNNHNGFPVLDVDLNIKGLISRNELIVAIKKGLYARVSPQKNVDYRNPFRKRYSQSYTSQQAFQFRNADRRYTVVDALEAGMLVPQIRIPFNWSDFNIDYKSTQYKYTELDEIVEVDGTEYLDLRAFMLELPPTVPEGLKINRVLDLFRRMNCRHLPVIEETGKRMIGIITRKDLLRAIQREKSKLRGTYVEETKSDQPPENPYNLKSTFGTVGAPSPNINASEKLTQEDFFEEPSKLTLLKDYE